MSEKEIIPGAYVLISYEARTRDNKIAESTKRTIKKNEETEEKDFPIVIKIGDKEVFFEEELIGLKDGEEKEIILPPEKAYGERDPKKITRIAIKRLRAMLGGRTPSVGDILYSEEGGYFGKVVYIGSRDALIDRNHPFAGEEILVHVKIHKVVLPADPPNEKISIIARRHFKDYADKLKFSLVGNTLEITVPSDTIMNLTGLDLLRSIYAPRKIAAEEFIRELNIDKVRYIEEFSILAPTETTAPSIAPSVTPVEEESEGEALKDKESEKKEPS